MQQTNLPPEAPGEGFPGVEGVAATSPTLPASPALDSFKAARSIANSPQAWVSDLERKYGLADPPQGVTAGTQGATPQHDPAAGKDAAQFNKEMAGAIPGGAAHAAQNTANAVLALADWGENWLASQGLGEGKLFDGRLTFADEMFPKPTHTLPALAQGVSQFLIPYLGATRMFPSLIAGGKAAQMVKGAGVGAAIDFMAFDPRDGRLSDLVQQYPALRNPVTDYLASKPADTEAGGRLKNSLEGLGLGALTEGLMLTLSAVRGRRLIKESAKASELPTSVDIGNGRTLDLTKFPDLQKSEYEFLQADAKAKAEWEAKKSEWLSKHTSTDAPSDETVAKALLAEREAMKKATADEAKMKLVPLHPEGKSLLDAVQGVDPKDLDKAYKINLLKYETEDDVKKAIKVMAEHPSVRAEIDEARRGVITDQQAQKLASELGLTVEQLAARQPGVAGNAEQIIATRRLLLKSSEDLLAKAKAAAAPTASDVDRVAFVEARDTYRVIQAQLHGLTAEAGRALRAFRSSVTERGQLDALNVALSLEGGAGEVGRQAQTLLRLADGKSDVEMVKRLGKWAQKSRLEKAGSALYEVYVNGLLSNPSTHAVNLMSNTAAMVNSVAERAMARVWGKALKTQGGVAEGEAAAMLSTMIDGFIDSARLAWKAAKEGRAGDVIPKAETPFVKAISAQGAGLPTWGQEKSLAGATGTVLDWAGAVVRAPSERSLIPQDAFYTSLNYRMQLRAAGVREASQKGLSGEAAEKFVKNYIANPSEEAALDAMNAAREATFTKPLEGRWADADRFIKATPGGRVLFPFVRTPMNVFEYQLQRTPLLGQIMPDFIADIRAGGVQRDMALARMSTGMAYMGAASLLAYQGLITGSGPKDKNARKLLEETGWRPHSLKIGDQYVAYDRIDPFGNMLGMTRWRSSRRGLAPRTSRPRCSPRTSTRFWTRSTSPRRAARHSSENSPRARSPTRGCSGRSPRSRWTE
jgi:hypothetical protein